MGDFGELSTHVSDVVLREALKRIARGLSCHHFGFYVWERLRSAPDKSCLFQARSLPALVKPIANIVRQKHEDRPQLGGNGGIRRK